MICSRVQRDEPHKRGHGLCLEKVKEQQIDDTWWLAEFGICGILFASTYRDNGVQTVASGAEGGEVWKVFMPVHVWMGLDYGVLWTSG